MLRRILAVCLFALGLQAQFFDHHPPSCARPLKTFDYTFFVVGYSDETRTPAWTAFEIEEPGEPILSCSRAGQFAPEPRADPVIVHQDYRSSGYSRGHLVPNAAMAYWRGCEANRATFITSNIVPQLQAHNAGVWEELETAIAGKKGGSTAGFTPGLIRPGRHVWVFSGPVFWGDAIQKISAKDIWVPTALWKTVIWTDAATHTTRTCSWIIPHRADVPREAYMDYAVSFQAVFEKTGINVLPSRTHALFTRCDAQEFVKAAREP